MSGFSPYDAPLQESQSDAIDGRFGGLRQVVDQSVGKGITTISGGTPNETKISASVIGDYTKRTTIAPNTKRNPVDETTKDVDDLNNEEDRKREASRRAETSTVGAANKYRRPGDGDDKTYSEPDNRPLEDTDAFIPEATVSGEAVKLRRSKNKYHFGSGQYDNMPNRGAYEGESR